MSQCAAALEFAQVTVELGVNLDPESFMYVVTDRRQRANVEGVFAAGDVTGQPVADREGRRRGMCRRPGGRAPCD